jgi:hypothetical protein
MSSFLSKFKRGKRHLHAHYPWLCATYRYRDALLKPTLLLLGKTTLNKWRNICVSLLRSATNDCTFLWLCGLLIFRPGYSSSKDLEGNSYRYVYAALNHNS